MTTKTHDIEEPLSPRDKLIQTFQSEQLTKEEIIQMDLGRMAYHEAGHIIVARHFGLEARAKLWPNDSNLEINKSVAGAMCFNIYSDKYQRNRTDFRLATVGYAGVIAEGIWDGGIEWENQSECDIEDWWQMKIMPWENDLIVFEGMSETDVQCAAKHPQSRRAVKVAANILRRRKKEFLDEVECLKAEFHKAFN